MMNQAEIHWFYLKNGNRILISNLISKAPKRAKHKGTHVTTTNPFLLGVFEGGFPKQSIKFVNSIEDS